MHLSLSFMSASSKLGECTAMSGYNIYFLPLGGLLEQLKLFADWRAKNLFKLWQFFAHVNFDCLPSYRKCYKIKDLSW